MKTTFSLLQNLFPRRTCGRNLRWKLSGKTLHIKGRGKMRDYYLMNVPWRDGLPLIEKVVIEDGVTTVGDYAFAGCTALTSVDIPNSVTSIYCWAFYGCRDMTEITLLRGVEKIGSYAFADCKSLSLVNCLCLHPVSLPASTFDGVDLSRATLRVPHGSEEMYRSAPVWR
ncbi:MAG: leucine-rich repeat domain-containing protein, partial [Dysgonamonadaceae bacterium]|nr:leucine-rich repeat domain-containing protein [Dysgonamonadaceae bacterium]